MTVVGCIWCLICYLLIIINIRCYIFYEKKLKSQLKNYMLINITKTSSLPYSAMSQFKDSNIITHFKASNVVKHFKELESTGNDKWWENYVIFDWSNIRDSQTTRWMSIKYTPTIGVKPERFVISIINEIHTGRILPTSVEEINELRTQFPGQYDEMGL